MEFVQDGFRFVQLITKKHIVVDAYFDIYCSKPIPYLLWADTDTLLDFHWQWLHHNSHWSNECSLAVSTAVRDIFSFLYCEGSRSSIYLQRAMSFCRSHVVSTVAILSYWNMLRPLFIPQESLWSTSWKSCLPLLAQNMGDCFIGIALLYLNLLVAPCKQAALGILSSFHSVHLPGVESGGSTLAK